ncbi:MAG: hypothetical protein WCT12_10350 [Verrucomicrobiota bacterium]
MNELRTSAARNLGLVFGIALLGALTGCVGYVGGPQPRAGVYVEPPSVYVESGVVVQPDYVYYPGYQVYYSSNTRQYVYQDGRSWVSRSAPPRVSATVLFASPSVRLEFHDSPAIHHAKVVRQYPKNWAPPGSNHGNNEGRDQGRDGGNRRGPS